MRIKEDKSSWRASGILKRDFKHGSADVVGHVHPKKDTKKWCKGKVGRKHSIVKRFKPWVGDSWRLTTLCENCSKEWWDGSKYPDAPVVNPEVVKSLQRREGMFGLITYRAQ